jgi:hypothetical protein
MKSNIRLLSFALPLLALAAPLAANGLRVTIEGDLAEWTQIPPLVDPEGDGVLDLLTLRAARDETTLVLALECADEFLLQEGNSLRLYLDADGNPATGAAVEGLGAELIWTFGSRSGTVYLPGSQPVSHDALGLRTLPTHSSTAFEIAIDLAAAPGGNALFSGSQARVVLRDLAGGDRLPDTGSLLINLAEPELPAFERGSLARAPGTALRLLSWNTEHGGLFDPAKTGAYTRLLAAIAPEVVVFSEIWDQTASQVVQRLEALVPQLGPWHAVKLDGGNAIATRLPVLGSWLVQPGYRETAVRLDAGAQLGSELLVIGCHLRCCGANEQRQEEMDGLVEFLRDAREPGGRLTLAPGTPIILAGDFNLVGDRQQLLTLLSGDIVDNASYGPDSPPDWDGGPLEDLIPRHLGGPDSYTWHDTGSSYLPGRLDFVIYTGSVLRALQGGVVWTPDLSPAELAAWGLQAGDAPAAADHIPLFADFGLPALEMGELRIGATSSFQVQLDWDPVDGANLYRVYSTPAPGSPWVLEAAQSEPGLDRLALPGEQRLFRVTAE